MDILLVADEPVRTAISVAFDDVDIDVVRGDADDVADARLAIVSDTPGSSTLRTASEAAIDGDTPWVAVEIGGLGGQRVDDIEVGITGFSPRTACYSCLCKRVQSCDPAVDSESTTDRNTVRFAGAFAAYETIRSLSGEESIFGHCIELPYVRRRLHPVPGCECIDTTVDRSIDLEAESISLEETVDRMETLIDERVGIITTLGEVESFPAPYYLTTLADTTAFSDGKAPSNAAGVSDDWNEALVKAVGESIERYAAAIYRSDDFHVGAYEDLDNAVSPADIVRPDDTPEFDPTAELRWVDGTTLSTDTSVYLPADTVHFPQPGDGIVPSITTGLGAGSTMAEAILSGLTEVIERYATMIAWYSDFDPMEVDVRSDRFDRIRRRASGEGLEVTTLLVTQDIDLPVITAAVHRDPDRFDWPHFAVGSAAAIDPNEAATGALEEAIQNWMELDSIGPERAMEESGAIGEYASMPEAAIDLIESERVIDASELSGPGLDTPAARIEYVCSLLTSAELTPHVAVLDTVDLTTLGFHVVRAVVPGLQPLFTADPYFGDRIETVPESLGFTPMTDRPFHPYP